MKTPVVLFLFKRHETLERIFEVIRSYKPERIYLLGDGPRNIEEKRHVEKARALALSLIDWECTVIKRFHEENVGVYSNIGEGASWVFEREKTAIFIEDDNLPEETFFNYCDELLEKYAIEEKVLWICGTNYMVDTTHISPHSYYYTRHLLPCGWASWSSKFLKYYDGELTSISKSKIEVMKSTYLDERLFHQELQTIKQTRFNFLRNKKSVSWDRQMCYSVRANGLYGIAPSVNQIKNIGVDEHSIHGGNSLKKEMTFRFCERETKKITFPLISPDSISMDARFERLTSDIILYPFDLRVKRAIGRLIKRMVGLDADDSLALYIKNLRKK